MGNTLVVTLSVSIDHHKVRQTWKRADSGKSRPCVPGRADRRIGQVRRRAWNGRFHRERRHPWGGSASFVWLPSRQYSDVYADRGTSRFIGGAASCTRPKKLLVECLVTLQDFFSWLGWMVSDWTSRESCRGTHPVWLFSVSIDVSQAIAAQIGGVQTWLLCHSSIIL